MKYFRVVMSVTSKIDLIDRKVLEGFIVNEVETNNLTVTEIDVIDTQEERR